MLNEWLAGNPASLVMVARQGESLQLGFKTAELRGSEGADFEVQYFWVELEPDAENVLIQLQTVISPLAYMRYIGVPPESILAISQDLLDLERQLEQEADDVMRTQLAQETATASASR